MTDRNGARLFGLLLLLMSLTALLIGSGCSTDTVRGKDFPIHSGSEETGVFSVDEEAERIVASMTDAEKVGQLLMIGIQGTDVSADTVCMLHEYNIGNIILFDRNMHNRDQVRTLTSDLQKEAGQKVPLFIGVDEEGGDIARMRSDLSVPPSQRETGLSGNAEEAKDYAFSMGMQLKDIGINLNFAPVADVSGSDSRSFGDSPDRVFDFVSNAGYGYERTHIVYVLKHFPGIGQAVVDSHRAGSVISAPRMELLRRDVQPFSRMFASHDMNRYMVLVSHLTYAGLDGDRPASLSYAVMTNLLRKELQYKGLIITDDMEMGAVTELYSFEELGVRSILAGADIIMVCHEYDHEQKVYNGILQALRQGRIGRERLDASVKRIVKTKLLNLR